MSIPAKRREASTTVDPQLERSLRMALVLGVVLVLLLPMARGYSDWLGWMPLWLVGMPGVALWALHRFRLPARLGSRHARPGTARRRKPGTQAHRRLYRERPDLQDAYPHPFASSDDGSLQRWMTLQGPLEYPELFAKKAPG